jgi:hypothetical protein
MCDRSEVSAQEKDALYVRKKAAAHAANNAKNKARRVFPEGIVYMFSTSLKCYRDGLRRARAEQSLMCAQKIE